AEADAADPLAVSPLVDPTLTAPSPLAWHFSPLFTSDPFLHRRHIGTQLLRYFAERPARCVHPSRSVLPLPVRLAPATVRAENPVGARRPRRDLVPLVALLALPRLLVATDRLGELKVDRAQQTPRQEFQVSPPPAGIAPELYSRFIPQVSIDEFVQ